jgi:hypothetical protein
MVDFCRAEQTSARFFSSQLSRGEWARLRLNMSRHEYPKQDFPCLNDRRCLIGGLRSDGIGGHDAGSTLPLLSFALLGAALLRRKLRC